MKSNTLNIANLSHKYSKNWAIKDINLAIDRTGIMGLLGSNGAGKSTTMNILCGVLNQTEGEVFISGINMRQRPEEAKKKIGFLPQNAPLYLDFTVDEYLDYCAHLRLIPKDKMAGALKYAKERCGIAHFAKRLIGNLSGGYKQRVGIAQAIIHNPELVVLDEPTNGLDPNQIVEVRSLIKEIASDRAVVFSSHILSEVRLLCNDITMIEGGRVVFSDTIEAFNNYVEPHSVLLFLENPPAEAEWLKIDGVNKVVSLTRNQVRIYFEGDKAISETLIETSVHRGWKLQEASLDKSSVDEIFAKLSSI